MKKNVFLVIGIILSIVMCLCLVGLLGENNRLKVLNKQLNKELLNFKMDPDKLKQEAYLAFKNEDDEEITRVVKLLEKYHIEKPQYAEAKGYLTTLANIREQRRIAEEQKFKFDVCGIYIGMSYSEYRTLMNKYKSSGKLQSYTDNLYCIHWFRTEEEVEVKAYGARSSRKDTFKMKADFDVILEEDPTFKNGKLSRMSFLISPSFEDGAIVSSKKNLDLITEYIDLVYTNTPICRNEWLSWSRNYQTTNLYNNTLRDDNGLSYYRLIILKE